MFLVFGFHIVFLILNSARAVNVANISEIVNESNGNLSQHNSAVHEKRYDLHENISTGLFWQLTDVHWDLRYSKSGDENQMCHDSYSVKGNNGEYGNYLCDSPWTLVRSALQAMFTIQPKPDFILWTGDNTPHSRDPAPDLNIIFKTLHNLTEEIHSIFGNNVPLIPVLGNHDSFPQNEYPASGETFYAKYLKDGGWELVIPAESQSDFEKGGYFAVEVGSKLKVISLNTNLYYKYNKIGTNQTDPAGQFSFLRKTLRTARNTGQKVIVSAHIPPGYWERNATVPFFNTTYNEVYVDLMNEFGDVIIAQIYGHEHTDSFRIFGTSHEDLTGVAFLAPSLTPWFPRRASIINGTSINPSVRLYSYDYVSVTDYYQFHLNLTEANAESKNENLPYDSKCFGIDGQNETCLIEESDIRSLWKLYYKASDMYGISRLNTSNMAAVYQRLYSNDTLFQQYYLYNSAGINHGYCGGVCRRHQLCAITHIRIDSLVRCIQGWDIPSTNHPKQSYPFQEKELNCADNGTCNKKGSHFILALSVGLLAMAIMISSMVTIVVVQKRKIIAGSQVSLPNFDWVNRTSHAGYRPLSVDDE